MTGFLSDVLAIVEAKSWDELPNVNKLYLATFGGVYNASPITQSIATQATIATGIFFKPDGTKVYEINSNPDLIYESDLSTPWDISTRVFLQSIATQDTASVGIFFKPDGTKMYEMGDADLIYESDLSTPWDISTRVFLQSIATQDSQPKGLFFKPDGTKMYEIGQNDGLICESDLSTPWDISTAVFLQSIATQDFAPAGIFFKPDGTKMYEIGNTDDLICESDLSTPWDISTATFARLQKTQHTNSSDIFFKPDGTKMYELGSFTPAAIYESDLSVPWDVSTGASFQMIATQDASPLDIFFKPDGTKMYEIGEGSDLIYESDLSTPWDISTAVFLQSVAAQATNPTGLFFSPDGTKMYEIAPTTDRIYESDLSTPWDISTRVFLQFVATQGATAQGLFFKPDGTKMYEINSTPDLIYESDLSTPWDISTRVFLQSIATQDTSSSGIFFKPDGTKMYEIGFGADRIYESDLSTPWDISTRVFLQSVASKDTFPTGLFFKPDGTKLYEMGLQSGLIYEIDLVNAWNILDQTKYYAARLTSTAVFESRISVVFWGGQTADPDFGFIDIGVADQNADIIDFAKNVTIADVTFYRVRANGTIRQLALAQTAEIAFADEDTIRLRLVSRLSKTFDLPINEFFYDASIPDLEGKPYPILWGPGPTGDINEARQMAPTLLVATGTTPTYHFTDLDVIDLSDADQAPLDKGIALDLAQFSIVANGFALDASAEGKITFFQPSDGGVEDPNDGERLVGLFRFLRLVAQRTDVYDYLFIPTLLELDKLFPEGDFPQFQTFDVVKLRDFMSVLFDSFAGYFYTDFNGIIQYGQLQAPEGQVAVFTFTDLNTTGTIQVNDDVAPNLSDRITYGHNWGALSDSDLAVALDDSEFRRARTLTHYEKKTAETIISFYQSARGKPALKWAGRYATDSDGPGGLPLEELTRWWTDLYPKRRRFYTFQSQLTEENATLSLGEVIRLQSDTFGLLNDPVNLIITRLRFDFGSEILTVEAWGAIPPLPAEAATNVTFTGTLEVGAILTGSYTYTDAQGLPESGSTYQWYRGESEDGSDRVAIVGATSLTYEAQSEDFFLYVFFSVVSSNGYTFAERVFSVGQLIVWIEGALGAYYDIQDLTTLFTTPTRAANCALGDAIALVLNQNPNASVVANFDGASGTYASTPDSAAASITGDITIRVLVSLADWTPASDNALVSKSNGGGNQRSFVLGINSGTGRPSFSWSEDGAVNITAAATAAPSVSDGALLWVEVALDVDNGAGGNTVTYRTSTDTTQLDPSSVTGWATLGSPVVTAGTTSIFNSTASVDIGYSQPATIYLTGRVARAAIYNSAGTKVVDMSPADYTSGTTFPSSTTGETWTLNGTAFIAPTDSAVQHTAPSRPVLGCRPKAGKRNMFTFNKDYTNAAWTKNEVSISGQKFIPSTNDASHYIQQAPTGIPGATVVTVSCRAKGDGYNLLGIYDSAAQKGYGFNLANGTTFTATDGGIPGDSTGVTRTMTPAADGKYDCTMTFTTTTAPTIQFYILIATDDRGFVGDGTSGIVLDYTQIEVGSAATSEQTVLQWYITTQADSPNVYFAAADGSNDYLTIPGSASSCKWLHDGTGSYLAGVFDSATVTAARETLLNSCGGGGGASDTGILLRRETGGTGTVLHEVLKAGPVLVGRLASANSTFPANDPKIISVSYKESAAPELSLALDGAVVDTDSSASAPSSSNSNHDIRLFLRNDGFEPLLGTCDSLFIINQVLSTTEQSQLSQHTTAQSGL